MDDQLMTVLSTFAPVLILTLILWHKRGQQAPPELTTQRDWNRRLDDWALSGPAPTGMGYAALMRQEKLIRCKGCGAPPMAYTFKGCAYCGSQREPLPRQVHYIDVKGLSLAETAGVVRAMAQMPGMKVNF